MSRVGGVSAGEVVWRRRIPAVVAVLALLALLPGVASPPAPAGAQTCQPLTDAQLVAQVIGAPLRTPVATAAGTFTIEAKT